jgi:mannose/fructose/N-acetylgalactosamine-specific phosphotransferase system component IIC
MTAWQNVALAGLWGGLVALERKAFLQAMLSRPLVASTGMGLLLQDLPSGLFIGMLLELFYLGAANLGAALPDHDTLAATGATAAAATIGLGSGAPSTPALWALAILLFAWLAKVGRVMDRNLERYSSRVARKALASAESGNLDQAMRQNLWGMWPHFFVFGGVSAACAAIGYGLAPIYRELPLNAVRGLAWAYPAMASVAAAIAARGSHAKRAVLYAGAAAALVALGGASLFMWGESP